ncbi:MAG: class putative F420-dependent enzyme [Naasia sp.]|jgi:PPOX class probable F420-dependent enzyme|uniref:TIGR03618 family F420-dependent PPOX class oxidoreductase n=1 Tax=Naasia sp. TaxID=2546198 RepID=UPI00261FF93B|nr:TIGR03618 family F420-dependent PPOX class oxidoreductase [Naasia sp.]MCU1570119.1 class putative F420-dependent enzyme [Naasia sp.]
MASTPEGFEDLLDRPIVGVLATVRREGGPSATPMWFQWDGEFLRFTHTTYRRKLRDLEDEPRLAFTIVDPDDTLRYLEVRGEVDRVEEDPTGAFYVVLGKRYGNPEQTPPPDSADRVIIVVRPTFFSRH